MKSDTSRIHLPLPRLLAVGRVAASPNKQWGTWASKGWEGWGELKGSHFPREAFITIILAKVRMNFPQKPLVPQQQSEAHLCGLLSRVGVG